MTNVIEIYTILFAIIILVGTVFQKSPVPTSLLLVITGIVLSLIPNFPRIELNPNLALNIFLPVLLYQISSFSSWRDVEKNIRPIALLSIGHVIFITVIVAIGIRYLIPEISWPIAFALGAVISPPDDVAIVSIAEKIRMPNKIVTILEGEGMLNDATALILFRFALIAIATNTFSPVNAFLTYITIIICETLYGLVLGFFLGELRLKVEDPTLHMMISLLTPFLAYLPPEMLGGSGILATVMTGFVIGHIYSVRFTPEIRLISRAIWPILAFAIQSILFLLVGLNFRFVVENISMIPTRDLINYSLIIIALVIIGRFIYVYVVVSYLPRRLFPRVRKKTSNLSWQFPFIISWAGMRGGISLAAALAVPVLPLLSNGVNPRDLLIFFVFGVILATLILQGLTLPWLLKTLGIQKAGLKEKYNEHIAELSARVRLIKAVITWLTEYQSLVDDDVMLKKKIKLKIKDYKMLKKQLQERIQNHEKLQIHDESKELKELAFLNTQIIEIEKVELFHLWREEKINYFTRNKILSELDHRSKHFSD